MDRREEFANRLNSSKSFTDVFRLVEDAVMSKYRARRAVMLALADLGAQGNYLVGAFHPVGSLQRVSLSYSASRVSSQSGCA
ncbi:MAG: hypothetical protein ACTSP1_06070 [Candidatus Freyarchaeota archaeon]